MCAPSMLCCGFLPTSHWVLFLCFCLDACCVCSLNICFVCAYMHIHGCVCVYRCVHACVGVYAGVCMCGGVCRYVQAHMWVCVQVCACDSQWRTSGDAPEEPATFFEIRSLSRWTTEDLQGLTSFHFPGTETISMCHFDQLFFFFFV